MNALHSLCVINRHTNTYIYIYTYKLWILNSGYCNSMFHSYKEKALNKSCSIYKCCYIHTHICTHECVYVCVCMCMCVCVCARAPKHHATKTCRRRGCIAPGILDLDNRLNLSPLHPGHFCPARRAQGIRWEAEWDRKPVGGSWWKA